MKRKSLLFLLLFALIAPWAANAQEKNLTVFDGTNTNSYVPFYGLYADYGTRSQFIIPASELEALTTGTISKLTFYSSSGSLTYDERVTVYMKEVDYTTFASAALEDWSTMTSVYTGTIGVTSNQMVIELSTPYTYGGGNLMIGFQVTTWGSSCPSSSWYGVNQATGTYTAAYNNANSSHTWSTTITRVAFIPKTTFTYTGGTAITCFKPTDLAASNVTTNAATLTWQDESADPAWTLQYSTNNTFAEGTYSETSVTGTPTANLSGLTSATTYYARVKPNCDTDGTKWSSIATFNTQCDTYNIPYTYGFEDSAPFGCWTVISGTITRISGYPNTGSYRLDFRGTTSNMIALPQFDEATNNLRVEFYTRPESTGGNSGKFAVGYMTDIADASTFVAVETYNSTEMTTSYVKKTVDFVNVPADANIAMRQFDCSTNYYWYVDDVTVKEMPSCLAPTGLAANATTTSAELSWTANSGETAWTLYWKKTTDETYTEVPNATNPYTLNGLDAATNYQYYVVANCSADDASEASDVFTFATECEAISIYPWTENFDSYTGATSGSTNNLPLCWNYINTCSYSSYKGYPVIYSASGYSHSGNNHLRFYSYYSSYSSYDPQDQYAILPVMENLNGKQLSLFARGANTNSSFKVGLMTDPTDVSTFVEIATTTPTTGYVEYTYNLTGTGNYIAIMMEAANSTATSRSVYIDDISIAEPPACPKPTDLTVVPNSVTPHSVQLSWVSDATAWIVAYKTAEEEEFTEVNATENPFTLTGLTDGKTYTAKVCAVCDGTPGEWTSTTVTFTTPIACPAPTNLAYSGITGSQTTLNWSGTSDSYDVLYRTAAYAEGIYEQFNTSGTPSGWTQYSGLVDEVIAGTATLSTGGSWSPNEYALGAYNMKVNIWGSSCKYWLVTPEFNLSQNLSFDLALTDYGNADPIEDATAQADDRFVVLIYADEAWTILREWNNTGSADVYNAIPNTGVNVAIDLSAYIGKDVKIAFYGESTASGGDNDLHIDNVYCGIPHEAGEWQTAAEGVTGTTYTLTGLNPETDYEAKVLSNCEGETGHETVISFTTEAACMVPTELTVVSVTTTTAELTWTSSSTAWQIQVNEEDPIDVTENPYTLEGLTPATTYTFKVRANCDGTYTDWSNAMSFTTECEVITTFPWTENFNSLTAGIPVCWDNSDGTTTTESYKWNYYADGHDGAGLRFNSYNNSSNNTNFLKTPTLSLPADKEMQLSFWYKNPAGGDFSVYISTDGGATYTTALATGLTGVSSWTEHPAIDLAAYAGREVVIVFKGTSNWGYGDAYIYLDDVTVASCFSPTNLAATDITINSATLTWQGTSDSYNVRYRTASTLVPSEGSLFEDFESGELTGWTTVRNDEGDEYTDWMVVNSETLFTSGEIPAHSGSYVAMSRSWDGDAYNVDNWLITPQVALNGELSYWVMDDGEYHEHYDIYISTTTNDISSFTLLYEPGDASETWTKYTYDLSSYAGQLGYIAFRHTDEDQDFLFIDDVIVGSMTTVPAGEWVELPPVSETFIEIDNLTSNTQYEYQIQGVCGDEPSSWSTIANFTTLPEGTMVFVTEGDWNEANNWVPARIPTVENNVIIREDATIPAGVVAYAKDATIDGGSITIADGGQLFYGSDNLVVTMQKTISAYTDANGTGNYYLLAFPFRSDLEVPAAMTAAEGNDFYTFDNSAQGEEWQNNRQQASAIDEVTPFVGYLYANPSSIDLSFTGTTFGSPAAGFGYANTYTYDADENEESGWLLLGNPLTCNAYIYGQVGENSFPMDVMYYDADGVMQTVSAGPVAPMQGFFVKITEDTTVWFMGAEYNAKSAPKPVEQGNQKPVKMNLRKVVPVVK